MIRYLGNFILLAKKIWQKLIISNIQKKMFNKCGENVRIANNCDFTYDHINIGNNVYIGPNNFFISPIAKITLGDGVFTGPNVTIVSGNHEIYTMGSYMIDIPEKESHNYQDVEIEDDVWIGANVIILKGVKIGKGSVVGAGSIVTKNVPPYTILTEERKMRKKNRFTEAELAFHLKKMRNKEGAR